MRKQLCVFVLLGACALGTAQSNIGSWTVQENLLPSTTQMAGAAVLGDNLYVIGGNNAADGDTSSVWRLKISEAVGSLGVAEAVTHLPASNNYNYLSEQVATTGTSIYVAGGGWNAAGPNRNNATYIKADASGNFVGDWQQTAAFPGGYDPELGAAVICSNGYLYAFCGDGETVSIHSTCVYAKVNEDGTLGAFQTGTAFPAACYFTAAAAVGNYIIATPGLTTKNDNATASNKVYVCRVNADGTMGAWVEQTAAAMPEARYGGAMIAVDKTLFYIGGRAVGAAVKNNVWRAVFDPATGALGAWSSTADAQLPDGVRYHAAVYSEVSKSIYVVSIRRASDGSVSNQAYISPALYERPRPAAVSGEWGLYE